MMKRVMLLASLLLVGGAFVAIRLIAQGVGNTGHNKENLDLPYDAFGEANEEEDAPEIVVFYGQNFEADGIFYCIDRSGSMQDRGELAIAKREVVRNVSEFTANMQFGIVFFDSNVLKFPPGGQPMEANPASKQSAIGWVTSMAGGNGSAIDKGLTTALEFSNRSSSARSVIVYVGDGGGSGSALLGRVRGQNAKNAQINCIGVLDVSNENRQFLQTLARMNNGTYTEIRR